MSEEVKVTVKMPMIPLRDVVIFPNTVSTLFVGREKSIFSLEDALRTNKKIFLVAQNSPSNEEPTIADLPKVFQSSKCSSDTGAKLVFSKIF